MIRDRYEAAAGGGRDCHPQAGGVREMPRSCDRHRRADQVGPARAHDHGRHPYDAHYGSRRDLAWEFAAILNQEAKELAAAGVDIVQFDEPAFNVFFDDVKSWGIAALERAAEGLECETAVHICYGYGIEANTDWKKTLGSEWRQYEETFPRLRESSIDIVSLECHNSHVPMESLELVRGKKLMVGAIDVASPAVGHPDVATTLQRPSVRRSRPAVALDQLRHGSVARTVARAKLAAGAGADRSTRALRGPSAECGVRHCPTHEVGHAPAGSARPGPCGPGRRGRWAESISVRRTVSGERGGGSGAAALPLLLRRIPRCPVFSRARGSARASGGVRSPVRSSGHRGELERSRRRNRTTKG